MPAIGWLLALAVAVGPLAAQTETTQTEAGQAESAQTESAQTATSGKISEARVAAIASAGGPAPDSEEAWPFPETPADRAPEVSLAGLLLKVGLGLSFVVGLAWGCILAEVHQGLGQGGPLIGWR